MSLRAKRSNLRNEQRENGIALSALRPPRNDTEGIALSALRPPRNDTEGIALSALRPPRNDTDMILFYNGDSTGFSYRKDISAACFC